MPKRIQKSLQDCLSKLKIPNKQIQFPLTSCKHGKTTSIAAVGDNNGVTLSDIDRFLFENFKSLYQEECQEGIWRKKKPVLLESPRLLEPPPSKNLCASARFFVESGSSSSRITDEPLSTTASARNASSTPSMEDGSLAPEDFISLLKYSPSPYEDFRWSMQEMVEVRVKQNGKLDWAFLEELLFCYLDLNNKKSYRYILRAFVDVIVVLRESSGKSLANQPAI